MTSVRVVCEGYLRKEGGVVLEAHSTSTLVSGELLVLVDTSSPERRGVLLEGLRGAGVDPGDVDVVVNTHLHHDHVGNNELFPRARKLARREERPGRGYEEVSEDLELAPGLALMHTPGHTRGSVSVVVETGDAWYVVAGDALPTRDNYERWVPPGINHDPALALDSMRRITERADVVVPGHGAPFAVDRPSRATKR